MEQLSSPLKSFRVIRFFKRSLKDYIPILIPIVRLPSKLWEDASRATTSESIAGSVMNQTTFILNPRSRGLIPVKLLPLPKVTSRFRQSRKIADRGCFEGLIHLVMILETQGSFNMKLAEKRIKKINIYWFSSFLITYIGNLDRYRKKN